MTHREMVSRKRQCYINITFEEQLSNGNAVPNRIEMINEATFYSAYVGIY